MEVWILVFIVIGILKLIPASKSKHSEHNGCLPWMGNRKRMREREERKDWL